MRSRETTDECGFHLQEKGERETETDQDGGSLKAHNYAGLTTISEQTEKVVLGQSRVGERKKRKERWIAETQGVAALLLSLMKCGLCVCLCV